MFKKMLDSSRNNSLANRLRRKRFRMFRNMLKELPRPVRILDLGGSENFWIQMGLAGISAYEITLVNTEEIRTTAGNIRYVKEDACNFASLGLEFDIIFSNSAIEHIGGSERIKLLASEIISSGRPFFVQTPSYYFPFEPHFLFPFFQYFPERFMIFLLLNFNMGWFSKCNSRAEAIALIRSNRLLKKSELKYCFPGAKLIKERFLGLTKSYIVLGSK